MKSFPEFLYEMTTKDAEALFGLSAGWTEADLTTAFRRAASKNHPDRGGSVEAMQQINKANDLLKSIAGKQAEQKSSLDRWEEIDRKYKAAGEFVTQDLKSRINTKKFEEHLERVFSEKFTTEIGQGGYYKSSASVVLDYQFKNTEKTRVFKFTAYVDLHEFIKIQSVKTLGADLSIENTPYKVSVSGFNYSDNRKSKISEADWNRNSQRAQFADPETVFPEKKISKKATRKFAKRDMETGLVALGAIWTTDRKGAYIPMQGGQKYFLVNRATLMGTATWSIWGTFIKQGYSFKSDTHTSYQSLLETEETLELFRKIASLPPDEAIKVIQSVKAYYAK